MALPDPFTALVDFLPKSARASYGFIRSLVNQVPQLSGNQIQEQLSAAGFGINRQTLQGIVSTLRNKADIPTFIRTFGENAIFPPSLHTVSAAPFRSGHKVVYEVGTNTTSELIPTSIYVGSNAPLSADQIYGAAAGQFTYEQGSGQSPDDLESVTFTIDDARFSPGLQTTGEFSDVQQPPPAVPSEDLVNPFASFEPGGIQAGLAKARSNLIESYKQGKISDADFLKRLKEL